MTKLLVLVVAILLVPHAHAATNPHTNLVIAIDLTRSVNVKGPDGTTEFQKDVEGVTNVLAQVPAGAHVTVIGITDHSFAQPYILLSASVPDDSGYFGERLNAARKELVGVWKQRSAHLEPRFPSTDILGALSLASQIFNQGSSSDDHRMLVLFSDMRNHTRELDLEAAASVTGRTSLTKMSNLPPVDLHQVQVYALGVDGAGQTTTYWQELEEFWREYFLKSGAALNNFSVLRLVPDTASH